MATRKSFPGAASPPQMDWSALGRSAHLVQFYEDDAFVVRSAAGFIGGGLGAGGSGVVIATPPHREAFEARLAASGIDVDIARGTGRYVALDAAETLSRFMVGGLPDRERFTDTVGQVLRQALNDGAQNEVRAFGEMVALLWKEGRPDAALELEGLWNELATKLPFSLFCAYPVSTFGSRDSTAGFAEVCGAHSHVLPTEAYADHESADQRLRTISMLQQKAAALEAEATRKDEFLAMLGHELRNPLAAIRSAIATASLDASRTERALEIARRQSDQLGRLIDDLLDVARITHGRIPLQKQRVHLAAVIERSVESARRLIDDRRHELVVDLPVDDIVLEADSARLEQIIVNLLTNAAKYTRPGGRIDLRAERHDEGAVVSVRDNGVGIAAEVLPHVFDLFAQADHTLDRADGGLGVGLTIARRLVELHDGRIEAQSDGPGRGATFTIRLPALPPQQVIEENQERPVTRSAPASVMIVEDNADAAESLMMLLELLGHDVRVKSDGGAALQAARERPPDVMLVDIGLPVMDGYELARQIRADPALSGVLLVALTGYGRDEDRERALAAGFDHHACKPVEVEELELFVVQAARNADTKLFQVSSPSLARIGK